MKDQKEVTIYTDGGASGNPGPGGYGAVLLFNKNRKELSGGYRLTTNNRMEIKAAIEGLKKLKYPCKVTLYSDSKYLVNAITKGWAQRWKKKGWKRAKNAKALNSDLWQELLELCSKHDVSFVWVPGHKGIAENERCDTLTQQVIQAKPQAIDKVYESIYYNRSHGLF